MWILSAGPKVTRLCWLREAGGVVLPEAEQGSRPAPWYWYRPFVGSWEDQSTLPVYLNDTGIIRCFFEESSRWVSGNGVQDCIWQNPCTPACERGNITKICLRKDRETTMVPIIVIVVYLTIAHERTLIHLDRGLSVVCTMHEIG
jgi:hypothetical protein